MEFCKLFRTVRKKQKIPNRDREEQKSFGVMDMRLGRIEQGIIKEPTVMVPNSIGPQRQLALIIYRMAHGCSFKVLKYIFGLEYIFLNIFLVLKYIFDLKYIFEL